MPDKPQRVLIFCADIAGHRHLYTARLARYLVSEGMETHVAYAGQLDDVSFSGRCRYIPSSPIERDNLQSLPGVQLHEIRDDLNRTGDDLPVIAQLQKKLEVQTTCFIDGDFHKDTLVRSASPFGPRLQGKQYAVYVNSEFLYEKRSGPKHWLLMLLRLPWLRFIAKQRQRFVRTYAGLNRWFFRQLVAKRWIERAFCLDENLARAFGEDFFIHTPEFGTRDMDPPIENEAKQIARFPLDEFRRFFADVAPENRVLMFGDLEARKGFDLLLQLARRNPDIRLARMGRIKPNYAEDQATMSAREELLWSGRFFEFAAYVNSPTLVQQMLDEASFLILPYRNYVRASAMMIDAVKAGLPLIVADKGLMAQRVREHGLGLTFRDGEVDSLEQAYRELTTDLRKYHTPIATYAENVSEAAFHRQLAPLLGQAHPQPAAVS